MHSRQAGALILCAISVPAILLLPKLHPAAVVILSAFCVGIWYYLRDDPLPLESLRFHAVVCIPMAMLLILALGRACRFTGESYPTSDKMLWIDLILLALAVYAAKDGMEKILRTAAICFFFLLLIYVIIGIFSIKNINIVYPTGRPVFNQEYTALSWLFLPLFASLFRDTSVKERKGLWAVGHFLMTVGPTVLVWITQSPAFASLEKFPFYAAVKTIRVFHIMERFEAILSAALTAGNFLLMGMLTVFGEKMLDRMFPQMRKGLKYCILFFGAVVARLIKIQLLDLLIAVLAPILWGLLPIILFLKKRRKILQKNEKIG